MGKNSQNRRADKLKRKSEAVRSAVAKINKMRYLRPQIFFDESGNTGGNLLDSIQSVFTLGSCIINKTDALSALKLTGSKAPSEAHFKTLRRRKSGQDGIIRLLESKYISTESVKVFLVDKKYMLTTKIVDLLIESWSHARSIDIYINGQNIALSNVFYYSLPDFCGEDKTDDMLVKFMKMIKIQDKDSIESFFNSIEDLKDCCADENFKSTIDRISVTKRDIVSILEDVDKINLDPAIPALFKHCIEWDKLYPSGYYIRHDDSKPIVEQQELFNEIMKIGKTPGVYGYDRRIFELPLKAKSLTFHSSEDYPQLQIADIIASAAAYYVKCLKRNDTNDYLFLELKRIKIDRYFKDMTIWPTTDVTPEDIGTVYTGGINAADGFARFLAE